MIWVAMAGPSGAGKDSLLDAVRLDLAADKRFHFARRSITRPATAGGEAHEALHAAAFAALLAGGAFLLHWDAHGLRYGIRRSEVPDDKLVILSLSRAVLMQAAGIRRLRVLEITAPRAILAERLARRGRETATQIEARLNREAQLPNDLDIVRIMNDGPLVVGASRLRRALLDAASACAEGDFPP